jgi:hypothetical protein
MTASRRVRSAATVIAAVTLLAPVAAFVLVPPWESTLGPQPMADFFGVVLLVVVYLGLGLALVLRRSENVISWLLLAIALIWSLNLLASSAIEALNGSGVAEWYANWSFAASVGSLLVLFHIFPTGRPVTGRWRYGSYVAIIAASLSLVPTVKSGILALVLAGILATCWLIGLATAIPVLVHRYHRAVDAERQQIKWFLFCVVAALMLWVLFAATYALGGFIALAMPGVGVAIALLRYHLYDIDRVISRATTYLIVTALVLGTYGLVVTIVIKVLPASSDLPIAAATLAAAAVARPAVRRVQAVVDRRFDRAKYDGQHEVDAFGSRLRHEVNPSVVLDDLMAVVAATVRPTRAGVWVRDAP